jgi:hypothetical protein
MWLDVEMWLPIVIVGLTVAIFFGVASQLHANS